MRVSVDRVAAFAVLLTLGWSDLAAAQPAAARTWPEIKCARYRQAWTSMLRLDGRRYGREFVESQDAFIASGCTTQGHVCPRSADELAAADTLTVLSMNGGTASTFLPFGCRP